MTQATPLRDQERVALAPTGDGPVPREIAPADLLRYWRRAGRRGEVQTGPAFGAPRTGRLD